MEPLRAVARERRKQRTADTVDHRLKVSHMLTLSKSHGLPRYGDDTPTAGSLLIEAVLLG